MQSTTDANSSARRTRLDNGRGDFGSAPKLAPLPRPEWLPSSEWPFNSYGISVGGRRVVVSDVGGGPVLLFVHTGMWSFIWRDVMVRLAGEFRCICIDAPGSGQSERLPRNEITLENSSHAVTEVIKQLGLTDLVLVLHDLGGPAGVAGAASVADRVRGIAAVNTFSWRPSGRVFRGMLMLMGSAWFREFDVLTQFMPRITSVAFGAGRNLSPGSRAVLRAGIGREGLRAFHYYMHDARRCDDLYVQVDTALAGTFQPLPFLTIFGERNDPFDFQARWKSLFPQAVQLVVPKGNHFPMCDAPDLVADELRSWHGVHVAPNMYQGSLISRRLER